MTNNFKKLVNLEQSKKITVVVHKDHANNFWNNTTKLGSILNWFTVSNI